MVTQAIESIKSTGERPMIKFFPEASGSLSFKKGEMVVMESDGQIVACADDATTILGMVKADATGTENSLLPVCIATDKQEFIMNTYHATAASAITAQSMRDQKFGYEVESNVGMVDIGQTSADALMVTEIIVGANKAIGDTYGRVKVIVLPEAQQFGATGT